MVIFISFVAIVAIGFILQWLSNNWMLATGLPTLAFAILALSYGNQLPLNDTFGSTAILTFLFGTPMVFFASLLGAYLYQTKIQTNEADEHSSVSEANQEE